MFIETPANKKNRKLINGVGVNDAWYRTEVRISGARTTCPFYMRWKSMLARCYSEVYHAKYPTYIDCSVCDEWLIFSNFKAWMIDKDWTGKHLDKDILNQGNKVYSPENCIFVTHNINTLLSDNKSKRGLYHQGVHWHARDLVFQSELSINGKKVYLGSFSTELRAAEVYKKAKYNLIKQVAMGQDEPLKSALLSYKIQLLKTNNG